MPSLALNRIHFDEFSVVLNAYKFDVIALCETLLKDNHHQLYYVKIPG